MLRALVAYVADGCAQSCPVDAVSPRGLAGGTPRPRRPGWDAVVGAPALAVGAGGSGQTEAGETAGSRWEADAVRTWSRKAGSTAAKGLSPAGQWCWVRRVVSTGQWREPPAGVEMGGGSGGVGAQQSG